MTKDKKVKVEVTERSTAHLTGEELFTALAEFIPDAALKAGTLIFRKKNDNRGALEIHVSTDLEVEWVRCYERLPSDIFRRIK